jgi:superfamily II DNA or RNA helicase
VGLVVPTGGGKTRIATRIVLQWLRESSRSDSIVIWVTHREHLDRQARRELQRALQEGEIQSPVEATSLFEKRIRFVIVSKDTKLAEVLAEAKDRLEFVVVDEAHHAAAPSYRPLFEAEPLRGLFLTATPNRADKLPIGIDLIPYSTTYRELFERGAIVEPVFDAPVTIDGFTWENPTSVRDLADYLLNRSEDELAKILVAVTRKEHAERLYEVIEEELDARSGHPLSAEDVAFVHGGEASSGADPADFLDEFKARPRGILVATSQLVGEGFDDPSIDGVVITYASTSIGHLMQVAGRALRWAPDKRAAHIVQVHASRLEYHFEQRWLYQDISDNLRPRLIDQTYGSAEELRQLVTRTLLDHNVDTAVAKRVLSGLSALAEGDKFNVLLTGIPYFDERDCFATDARWGAIGVDPGSRETFIRVSTSFQIVARCE